MNPAHVLAILGFLHQAALRAGYHQPTPPYQNPLPVGIPAHPGDYPDQTGATGVGAAHPGWVGPPLPAPWTAGAGFLAGFHQPTGPPANPLPVGIQPQQNQFPGTGATGIGFRY